MEPHEDESPIVLALPGVIDHDWQALVARGRTQGFVHAEDVAHVVRDVELTTDVLISVSDALAKLGIEIDDAVEVEADHDATPASDVGVADRWMTRRVFPGSIGAPCDRWRCYCGRRDADVSAGDRAR